MSGLGESLRSALAGRAVIVGVGNSDLGDDGFGPCLAQTLSAAGHPDVIVAATTPERWMGRLVSGGYDSVLFLDALEFHGEPGAAVVMDASEIETHFPQVSTHKLSLGTLARLIRRQSGARVHLLGVRPASLKPGAGLSHAVEDSTAGLASLLGDVLAAKRGPRKAGGSSVEQRPEASAAESTRVKCEAR